MVVEHFWCRKIREIVCRVPREWVKSKFLCHDADVMSLADKCIVVGCFFCRDYDKILVISLFISMQVLLLMNAMLDFICVLFAELTGTETKWLIQNENVGLLWESNLDRLTTETCALMRLKRLQSPGIWMSTRGNTWSNWLYRCVFRQCVRQTSTFLSQMEVLKDFAWAHQIIIN